MLAVCLPAFSQNQPVSPVLPQKLTDEQKAAMDAAKAINGVQESKEIIKEPSLWTNSFKSNINFGQTSLTNWAAGGCNTYSLKGYIDTEANYNSKDEKIYWNNRLQLDYGIMYSADKPVVQKSDDRIYLESKWGRKLVGKWSFSAGLNFKTQFTRGWDYKTPSVGTGVQKEDGTRVITRQDWRDARELKSSFMAPGYFNIAVGIDYIPCNWFTLNVAPLTGGFVAVIENDALRKSYGMPQIGDTEYYRPIRPEFGAQIKCDFKVKVNDNFAYTSQVLLFYNYLTPKVCPRINWDNRLEWKLAKYFALCLTTNLIYDKTVMIKSDKDIVEYPNGRARVQFMESFQFGFTYTISNKK